MAPDRQADQLPDAARFAVGPASPAGIPAPPVISPAARGLMLGGPIPRGRVPRGRGSAAADPEAAPRWAPSPYPETAYPEAARSPAPWV